MPHHQSVNILLIEDDPGHARLIERNLRRIQMAHDIMILSNGQEAVDYLLMENSYAGATHPTPLLILLDLNLPGLDGYQVLARLKVDTRTKHIPVIIFTTMDDPREVEKCYALGCNAYLTKPVEYEGFTAVIGQLGLFLSVVQLPHRG